MVERDSALDRIFFSLSDATRRDMLGLLRRSPEMGVGEIAAHYRLTFAGVAKHVKVLEAAGLVKKRRAGKQQMVSLRPETAARARDYLNQYASIINERFDRLDALLTRTRQ
jgi:DNA-binding transcriptional ArsR family regulator